MSSWILLSLGTLLMLILLLFLGRTYEIASWKMVIFTFALAVMGLLGTKIMSAIESGNWAGRSFFGAVLFTPILMLAVGLILQISPKDTLDLCAPGESLMLVVMKYGCILNDCCIGRVIKISEYGKQIRFPSQIVECINAGVITILLTCLIYKRKHRGHIYAIYMITYGVTRFIWNGFRETVPYVWKFPAGSFWALISLLLGVFLYSFTSQKSAQLPEEKKR